MNMDIETTRTLCKNLFPEIEQIRRQYKAALNECVNVAAKTGENEEKILQEAKAIAAASTMTVAEAIWHVTAQKQREHIEKEKKCLQAGG